MTGLLILTFIPAAAAILFWLRLREQRRVIDTLQARVADAGSRDRDTAEHHAQLFGTVAHELRSPIAAILGYEELLTEGVFGTVDERATEALSRIRSSARQLLTLTDGMHELSGRDSGDLEVEDVDFARALRSAYHRTAVEAEARRVRFAAPAGAETAIAGTTERRTVDAILDAVLGAAMKSSANRTVRSTVAVEGDTVHYRIENTGLDIARTRSEPLASGAGLRIVIADRMAQRLGGSVRLVQDPEGSMIDIVIPRTGS